MASSRATIVATAAVALQAASGSGTFSGLTFNVVRQYVPGQEIANLDELTLTMPPIGPESRQLIQRDLIEKVFAFDIGVQKRLPSTCNPETPAGNAAIDPLMQFVEQVAAFFEPNQKTGNTGNIGSPAVAFWKESRIDPPYDPAHLRELRVFTSRITIVVRYY